MAGSSSEAAAPAAEDTNIDATNIERIRVAILYDPVKREEAEPGYPSPALEEVLAACDDIDASELSLAELLAGGLDDFTCLCVPGGFAHNYASRLGADGMALIQQFVASGGGYVGICAGAYVGSAQGLALLPVECEDVHRWARGSGPCQLRWTQMGHRALGTAAPLDEHGELTPPFTVRYNNGPCMRIQDGSGAEEEDVLKSGGGAPKSLATFCTEFRDVLHAGHRFGSRLEGSPAVVAGRYQRGTEQQQRSGMVVLASPHLEDATDVNALIPFGNLFRLASRESFYQRFVEANAKVG